LPVGIAEGKKEPDGLLDGKADGKEEPDGLPDGEADGKDEPDGSLPLARATRTR
jgi:hypothetical protein